jgi:hypothetical protein
MGAGAGAALGGIFDDSRSKKKEVWLILFETFERRSVCRVMTRIFRTNTYRKGGVEDEGFFRATVSLWDHDTNTSHEYLQEDGVDDDEGYKKKEEASEEEGGGYSVRGGWNSECN